EPLIARQEYRAAMALLMTWLSEGEAVPLEDPSASFEALCERWVRSVASAEVVPAPARAALVRRFFELLDANASEAWLDPAGWLEHDEATGGDDAEGSEYGAAYGGVTYKDST